MSVFRTPAFVRASLAVVAALTLATGAEARIVTSRGASTAAGPLRLVLGSGFEYETDAEESEYGFPFFAEYGFNDALTLTVEPSAVVIRRKSRGDLSGFGDLETTLTAEIVSERRHRPAFAIASTIKWPTAKRGDLGTGERDVSIGAIVSKEFLSCDVDANVVYTFIGDPPGVSLKNTLEASLASEWHPRPVLDVIAEVVTHFGAGGTFRGGTSALGGFANIGGPEQGQAEFEVTLGLAERLGEFLKFEQGVVAKNDGAFQFVIAWEYDFAGQ